VWNSRPRNSIGYIAWNSKEYNGIAWNSMGQLGRAFPGIAFPGMA